MAHGLRWTVLNALGVALQLACAAGACQGATFLDWLGGRTPYYYPHQSTAYTNPPTTYAPVSAVSGATPATTSAPAAYAATTSAPCACGMPATATAAYVPTASSAPTIAYSPTVTYAPAATCAPCGPQPAAVASSNWVPTVRYRTSWVRVPVTYYRPVTAVDATTGCPTTGLQPCNSYQWQLRRVPTVAYRPAYSCWRWPWSQPAVPAVCPPACSGVPAAAPVAQPYAVPYAAPPYSTTPGPTLVPGPAVAPGTAPSPVPADNPPSLQPGALPPGTPQPGSPGAAYRPLPPTDEPGLTPHPAANSPALAPPADVDAGRAEGATRETPEVMRQPTYTKPVPDPESHRLEPPQLLDPRDRTAARSGREVVRVSWPDPQAHAGPGRAAPPPPTGPRWDDSGWQSAGDR